MGVKRGERKIDQERKRKMLGQPEESCFFQGLPGEKIPPHATTADAPSLSQLLLCFWAFFPCPLSIQGIVVMGGRYNLMDPIPQHGLKLRLPEPTQFSACSTISLLHTYCRFLRSRRTAYTLYFCNTCSVPYTISSIVFMLRPTLLLEIGTQQHSVAGLAFKRQFRKCLLQ